MNKSETIAELAKALSKAQAEIKGAVKDSENPFFKASYADLESVWDACRKPLTDNGLSVVQLPHVDNDKVIIETILLHSSGEWISGELAMTPVKSDPQGLGSCISYNRRYSLASVVGVYQTDDDAEGAHGRKDENKDDKKQDKPKYLSCAELVEKMTSAINVFELKARYEKYAHDISALSGEDRVKVGMAKDKRKTALQIEEKAKKEAEGGK